MGLLKVLGGTSSQDESGRLGLLASSEHVIPFISELDLFELSAFSENIWGETLSGSLEDGTSGLGDSLQVIHGDTTSAEDISVSEVLGGEVTDWAA